MCLAAMPPVKTQMSYIRPPTHANQMPHRAYTYVGMQIADVKDSEIVKFRGKIGESHAMFFDNDVVSVSTRTAIKSNQLQRSSDNPRRCVPVFKIEKDQSLSKQLGPHARLQFSVAAQHVLSQFARSGLAEMFRSQRSK
jgi:hypothetical protein